jgi:hypothetical protein
MIEKSEIKFDEIAETPLVCGFLQNSMQCSWCMKNTEHDKNLRINFVINN